MVTIIAPQVYYYWLPSRNPIVYTIQTTNTMPRLSYIINVIINGNLATKLKYPVYDRNSLSVDLMGIVNDYIKDVFVNDEQAYTTVPDEVCSVTISVDEEYFDTNTNQMVVDLNAGLEKKPVYIWRSVADFQHSRNLGFFVSYFDLTGSNYDNYGKFLGVKNWSADVPLNTLVGVYPVPAKGKAILFKDLYPISPTTRRTAEFFTTSTFTNGSKHTMYLHCWCFNSKMELTKFFWKKLHNGAFTPTDYQYKIGCIPVGIPQLNNLVWDYIGLVAGTLNYIDESEDKYYFITVCGVNSFGTPDLNSQSPTPEGNKWIGFEIIPCSKFESYNILYKTAEGGWWQIRADKKHFNETNVKTNIKYNTWGLQAKETLPSSARFKQTMHTEANGSIILNTDWINNQGIIQEIEEMIISPEIYLVLDDDYNPLKYNPTYIPVLLKDTTHQIWNKDQDKMIQYEFEFEEAYKKGTLR